MSQIPEEAQSSEAESFSLREFFNQPLSNPKALPFLAVGVLVAFIAPQIPPGDWFLNTQYLPDGLNIYANESFVYPPWSLWVLWIYKYMTATGSRIISALILGWLVISRQWALKHYLALLLSPFFIFSLPFSNLDILVLITPILLWEFASRYRWAWIGWGIAISIIMVKPQGAILLVPYLIWRNRERWQQSLLALLFSSTILLPISFVGSPPLILQWLHNVRNPSDLNVGYWNANNISMTSFYHPILSFVIVVSTFGCMYWIFRQSKREWNDNHSYIALMLSSMLLSPYASTQSVIGALAFAPSITAITLHWILTLGLNAMGVYTSAAPLWLLLYGIIALLSVPKPVSDNQANI